MEIIMRKVETLIPYERNAKKHDQKQIDNVANSIRRFGWQQPIVIDENDVVVIGHCRLLAAKKLGLSVAPCTVTTGLTDEEVRELRIMDNKLNESQWDIPLLEEEVSELLFEGFQLDFPEFVDIDWQGVEDLSDETYEKPEKEMLECPMCHHVDSKAHFKKASVEE